MKAREDLSNPQFPKQEVFMKHAYYAFTGGERNYFERQENALRFGCDGIEYLNVLDLSTPSRDLALRLKENADRLALPSPCFSMYVEVMQDPAASVKEIEAYIDMAEILGCPYFHHTYGPILAGQSKQDYLKTAVDVAKQTASYAAERGIHLLIEPQGATMNGVEMLGDYLAQMDGLASLILDTGNIFESGDTSLQLVKALGDKVKHVHVKDMIYRDKLPAFPDVSWRHCPNGAGARQTVVGQGVVDFYPVLEELKRLGYDGWYALEYDALETHDLYYPVSLSNFKKMYESVFNA